MITCPNCGIEIEEPKHELTPEETQQANDKVTAMIEAARAQKLRYANREKVESARPAYLPLCDAYVEAVGKDEEGNYLQEPNKKVLFDWICTFEDWVQARITPDIIRRAYKYATGPEGGFLVGRPGALTKTAIALKSQPVPEKSKKVERTQSKIDMLRNRDDDE